MYDSENNDRAVVPFNEEEAVVLNFGDFRIGIPWPLLEGIVHHIEDGNRAERDIEVRNKGFKGFRAAMRATTPFIPLMEPMLRQLAGPRLPKWDRKHGGLDAFSYGMGWLSRALILMISQVVWDAEYATDDSTKTLYVTSIRVPKQLEDSSLLGIEPPLVESGYIPGPESISDSERRVGDAGDSRMRQDDILEASDLSTVSDVSESTSVHPR